MSFEAIRSEHWIPIIAIAGGCLVAIVGAISVAWRKVHETSALADLKRDLVAQGRSTEEIERICNAGSNKKC